MFQQLMQEPLLPEHPLRIILNLLPVDQEKAVTVNQLLEVYNAPLGGRDPIHRRTLADRLRTLCERELAHRAGGDTGAGGRPPNVYWRTAEHAPEMMGTSIALRLVIAKAALDAVLGDDHPLDQVQEVKANDAINGSTALQRLKEAVRILPPSVETQGRNNRSAVVQAIKIFRLVRLNLGSGKEVVLSVRGLVAGPGGHFVVGHLDVNNGDPEVQVINLDQVEDAEVTDSHSYDAGNFSLDNYIDANRNLFG